MSSYEKALAMEWNELWKKKKNNLTLTLKMAKNEISSGKGMK